MAALAVPQENTVEVIFVVDPRPVTTLWLGVKSGNNIYFLGYFTQNSWRENSDIDDKTRASQVNTLFYNIMDVNNQYTRELFAKTIPGTARLTQQSKNDRELVEHHLKIIQLRTLLKPLEFVLDGAYGYATEYVNMTDVKITDGDFEDAPKKYVTLNNFTLDDMVKLIKDKGQAAIIQSAVNLIQLKTNTLKLRL